MGLERYGVLRSSHGIRAPGQAIRPDNQGGQISSQSRRQAQPSSGNRQLTNDHPRVERLEQSISTEYSRPIGVAGIINDVAQGVATHSRQGIESVLEARPDSETSGQVYEREHALTHTDERHNGITA